MGGRILCVAEKPSIARAVAQHLGGQIRTANIQGNPYVKNYSFDYSFPSAWGSCNVVFTSVAGHVKTQDFHERFKNWRASNPAELFEAPILSFVDKDRKPIAKNIESQARGARALFIWTDCDREGEHIGTEIREIALKVNPSLEIKRARFSNIERAHVIQAARNPVQLDENQANAVAARIELDLRIGAAFTRMQTLQLRPMIEHVYNSTLSYGSCQFPTLGFVVDRYFKVKNFVPEPFWYIKVTHRKDNVDVRFTWNRGHLFDRMVVTLFYEQCLAAKQAKVTKMQKKPTSKWRPLPLTTVELQKNGSRFLRMDSQRVMKIAEDLYTKGWISYPRTETDQFDRGMNLQGLVEKQTQDTRWGNHAQGLLDGGFRAPRSGSHNDQAHPPIHPVNYVAGSQLTDDQKRVYEFVVRRFLACCSEDAKGEATDVEIQYGDEFFHAHGLRVLERNYLDVYPYDKWESSQQLPAYAVGETFIPTEAVMNDGKTSPPQYLTEPELIALMDANGIGTDATMAEHIAKIKERQYVVTTPRSAQGQEADPGSETTNARDRGGRGRGRGRGGAGRGGSASGSRGSSSTLDVFVPTKLGVALIEGYDKIGLDLSLGKPFLRKEMETHMRAICAGTTTQNDVIHRNLEQFRAVYAMTTQQLNVLKASFHRYLLDEQNT